MMIGYGDDSTVYDDDTYTVQYTMMIDEVHFDIVNLQADLCLE